MCKEEYHPAVDEEAVPGLLWSQAGKPGRAVCEVTRRTRSFWKIYIGEVSDRSVECNIVCSNLNKLRLLQGQVCAVLARLGRGYKRFS